LYRDYGERYRSTDKIIEANYFSNFLLLHGKKKETFNWRNKTGIICDHAASFQYFSTIQYKEQNSTDDQRK
jgi:hypothetical protein